ncbi:MAG: tape measure protein [Hyphomicrobiaceae bacterium]
MAKVSRSDVELVLTARDEVTRTLAEVSALLDKLSADAQDSGSAMANMDARAERLRGTLEGLRDAQGDLIAKGRLVEQFKREEQQLSRLNERFRQAAAEVRRLRDEQRAQAGVPVGDRANLAAPLASAQADAQRANRAFREMRDQVRRTSEELNRQGVATNDLAASQRRLVAEAQRLRAAQDQTAAALARTGNAGRSAAAGMRLFSEDSRKSLGLVQRLRGEIIALAAGYVGLFGAARQVGALFSAAQDQARIESGLRVAFDGDEAKVRGELDFLRQTSDRLAVSFLDLGKSYSQFLAAVPEGTFTLDESRQVYVGVATAGRVLRLSNDQMERSFRAIIQIVSKGTVQMEELRGQLGDNLPGALLLFAKANGVAIESLEKLVEQRQITSASLIPFGEELERKFGKDLAKVLAEPVVALDILRVAWERTLLEMGEDTEVIDSLADAFRALTEALDDPGFRAGLESIANGFAALVRMVPPLIENIGAIGKAFAALALTRVAVGILGVVVRMRTLIQTVGLLGAVASAGAGPLGWAIGLGTLFLLWGDGAAAATPKIKDLRRELEALRDAREGVNGGGLRLEIAAVDEQIAAVEKRIKSLQQGLDEGFSGFTGVDLGQGLDEQFELLDLLVQKHDELSRQQLPPQVVIPTASNAAGTAPGKATPIDPKLMEDLADAIKKANDRIAELNADTLVQKLALITRKYAEQAAAARLTADTADDALVSQAIAAEQRVLRLETEKKLTEELKKLQQDVDRQGDRGLAGQLSDLRAQYQGLIDGLSELGRTDLAAQATGLVEQRIGGEIAAVKDRLQQELTQLRADEEGDLDARLELVRQKYQATIEALNGVDLQGAALAQQLMDRRLDAARKAFSEERIQEAQAEIDKALELRNAIIQRIEAQRELGNLTAREAGDQLRTELADLDPRLQGLIDKARELVQTLRGEGLISDTDAQIALENLRAIEMGMDSLKTQAQEFAGQIREAIATGMTDAITDFVTGVSSAGDAIRKFFADFLRMIAQAIIQQQILNALQGGAGGGGGVIQSFANWAFGTNHGGGMAGTGPKRMINPLALLGGVPTFHSGGLVGNNEVLSLLRTNEEVLTRNDPRHVLNGGAAGGGPRMHVYNFFDRAEFLRAVADTPAGDDFVINTINRNRSRVR